MIDLKTLLIDRMDYLIKCKKDIICTDDYYLPPGKKIKKLSDIRSTYAINAAIFSNLFHIEKFDVKHEELLSLYDGKEVIH